MTNSTTPVEKRKRSRIIEYLAVVVVLAVVVLAAMYQEQLSAYVRLKMWDQAAPGRAVEQMLTAGRNGDQQTVRRLLGTQDLKDLVDEQGKWRGLFMVTQAGTLDFYMDELAPAGEIKAKETEFFTIGKGHAEVHVPDSTGKLVKYRVEIVDGEWKVMEILAGKPRAAAPRSRARFVSKRAESAGRSGKRRPRSESAWLCGWSSMTEASQEKSRSVRLILSLILLLLLVVAAFVYVPMWIDSYRRGQLQKLSLTELEQLTKNQPGNTEALYRLGVAYGREGRYPDAVHAFLAVLEREPTRADVLNDLGVTYMLMERYYESLVAYQGALQIKPDYATAHANLGRLYLATKMPFSANRSLQRAIELDPRNLDTLCDLGEAGQQTLNLQQAEDAYKRALAINDRHAPAYIGLGKTYYSRGRLAESEQMIRKALALDPQSSVALMTLARIRLDKPGASDADLREAQDYLQRALKADDQNPDIWYDLGRISLRQNRPAEAIEHLKKALILSPQHMGAMQQTERALRLAGRKAEADRVARIMRERALREREEMRLEETVGRSPKDWDSQAKLAQLYILSGKRGLAMLIVRRMQQEAPQHPALPDLQQALDAMQAQQNQPNNRP